MGCCDSYLHKGAFVDSLSLIREKTIAHYILKRQLWHFERMTVAVRMGEAFLWTDTELFERTSESRLFFSWMA